MRLVEWIVVLGVLLTGVIAYHSTHEKETKVIQEEQTLTGQACKVRFRDWTGGVWKICKRAAPNSASPEWDKDAVWVKCDDGKRWRVTSNVEYSEECHD